MTESYPPTLLIHGDRDTDVPYEQSTLMAAQLKANGISVRLITVENGEHGLSGGDQQQIAEANNFSRKFIVEHLQAD